MRPPPQLFGALPNAVDTRRICAQKVAVMPSKPLKTTVNDDVERALVEDVGDGDLSALAIPAQRHQQAYVVAREAGLACGRSWFDRVFARLDERVVTHWHVHEGEQVAADTVMAQVTGPARAMYTGERTALNFLSLLCGMATATRAYVDAVEGTDTAILGTRKTLPGLRAAQRYAVACGGGTNHRMGLFDAAMLKENHIHAAGGIAAAVDALRAHYPDTELTVEIESLDQLRQALAAGAERVLLDNFGLEGLRRAVEITGGRARVEASGGVDRDRVAAIAATGVDAISVGALTKDVDALDLSMRFVAG